jgi:hypothetical protein
MRMTRPTQRDAHDQRMTRPARNVLRWVLIQWRHDMTYDEAMQTTVSHAEAQREVESHGLPMSEFVEDNGEHAEYDGDTVMNWLGY